jgi:hypothetical protein
MKVLLSWPFAFSGYVEPPNVIVALVPTRTVLRRAQRLMRKAEKLESKIDGFVRMVIQDWNPLFLGANELKIEDAETGLFQEADLEMTEKELADLARSSCNERIETCVVCVEKGRIYWEFYTRYLDTPCYTGDLERKFVERRLLEQDN